MRHTPPDLEGGVHFSHPKDTRRKDALAKSDLSGKSLFSMSQCYGIDPYLNINPAKFPAGGAGFPLSVPNACNTRR